VAIKNFVELGEVVKRRGSRWVTVVAAHEPVTLLAASGVQKQDLA
jgi:hypothetical protein